MRQCTSNVTTAAARPRLKCTRYVGSDPLCSESRHLDITPTKYAAPSKSVFRTARTVKMRVMGPSLTKESSAMPTALRGHVVQHGHAKPWPWHPKGNARRVPLAGSEPAT